MKNKLFLIGYRGSGKSTIAPLIAALAGCDWVDTDDLIQRAFGGSIADIFAEHGEAEFRRLESQAIADVSSSDVTPAERLVVSLGGGAITIAANRPVIRSTGIAVYLRGRPDTLWQRIRSDAASSGQRPSLTDLDGQKEVEAVLAARREVYESSSDVCVDIDDLSPQSIADKIFAWWQNQRSTFDQ